MQQNMPDDRNLIREKAESIVSQMTLEEMFSQLVYNSPAVPHLHIPAYNWWNEGLHGAARSGTATVFPQAIALAAMFDVSMMKIAGDIVSTEQRAKYNAFSRLGDRGIYKGLTVWSPNINIFRDPRWGRGQETYGEDPLLTGELAESFISGLQGDDPRFLKTAACVKHFAAHSGPEALRHSFNAVVSPRDLEETYLPAFRVCIQDARADGVMGAYTALNGEPTCGSPLIQTLLRDTWNFSGIFISDCWAVRDFHQGHKVTGNLEASAAKALNAGCDLNCGCEYLSLDKAYRKGLISRKTVYTACVRVMTTRLKLGLFSSDNPYEGISFDIVDCDRHAAAALRTAEKSLVLLKNSGSFLPLTSGRIKNIAVIGPEADSRRVLWGNYHGTASRNTTVLEGMRLIAGSSVSVRYAEGCALDQPAVERLGEKDDRISEAVSLMQISDICILCLGLDESIEGEMHDDGNGGWAGDRKNLCLPECQQRLLQAVAETGKPVIVALFSGGGIDPAADGFENIKAVIQCWYPGQSGGLAIARLIFGLFNPSGKLPVTFYKKDALLPDFTDYSMRGRTYRYYQGEPLYPFAYGLSYTTYEYAGLSLLSQGQEGVRICFSVKNTGFLDGEETSFVWCHLLSPDSPPNPVLYAFRHSSVPAGGTIQIEILIPYEKFSVVTDAGNRMPFAGPVEFWIGGHQPDKVSMLLTGTPVLYRKCSDIRHV